jgi:radical SAM superfamily enzyme YgiQ (UPF0313 family)
MSKIILASINAKFIHASFGLRYLLANLGELSADAKILEFETTDRIPDIAEAILSHNPKILGLGVYIWNARQSLELVKLLKRIIPDLIIVLGGPEVSYETDKQEIISIADYTICGEADFAFKELCQKLLTEEPIQQKIIRAALPKLEDLKLPYHLYTDSDLSNRVIYVEASRGCPFTCEFCLSSLDIPVRQFELDSFLNEMDQLIARGLKQFKFVDRTFNLNIRTSKRILEFFLERYKPGHFFHFEMIPDRLPEGLKETIIKFPKGSLQFEVGIQTFNPEVSQLINRRQDYPKITENLSFLREKTGVHIHADLIAGLPGETLESFASGFDKLVTLRPHEIQLGILKRLHGTPITRHDESWKMTYNPHAPYEILKNKLLSFSDMQRISRFAHFWDRFYNSGNFVDALPLLWLNKESAFHEFMKFSDWLYQSAGRRHSISLSKLTEYLWNYLNTIQNIAGDFIVKHFISDFERTKRQEIPEFMKSFISKQSIDSFSSRTLPRRQAKHIAQNAPS